MLLVQRVAIPRSRALLRAGSSMAARMAMIAITTRSSMRVKLRYCRMAAGAGRWKAGGVSAAPRTPCVRQGAGAGFRSAVRPGSRSGAGRWEREPRKSERLFPLFCGKTPSHFRSPSPVPSRCELARACSTAGAFDGSAVRGETRHEVPLSLPRAPLFPARGSSGRERRMRAGGCRGSPGEPGGGFELEIRNLRSE